MKEMDAEKMIISRRKFLEIAALGAIASQFLPGSSSSNAAQVAPRTITVIGAIDVAQALADNSLNNNLYWIDNNKEAGSRFLGTDHLKTSIKKGDYVQWLISGLQVETFVDIAGITGPATAIANPVSILISPGTHFLVGRIAADAKGTYHYRIKLQVEKRMMITSSQLALDVQ